MKAVVIGGGTGTTVSIKVLQSLGIQTDAVVAMADDGGSSGMLREHTGKVPPGDVRKCLVAMAKNPQNPWARVFASRYQYINNHTVGNLILLALEDATRSFTDAIRLCEELLEAQGHVHPSTLENIKLSGLTRDGKYLDGQSTLCKSQTALARVKLTPATPRPNQAAIDALLDADIIVLGPGSLFTSIIPNVLVPGIVDALHASQARKVFISSVGDTQGETWGLTAYECLEALLDHGLDGGIDVMIAQRDTDADIDGKVGGATGVFQAVSLENRTPVTPTSQKRREVRSVQLTSKDAESIRRAGVTLIARDFRYPTRPTWHDRIKLADALKGVIASCRLPQK